MPNDFYNASGTPSQGSAGSSATMRAEFAALAAGFDKLPTLAGNAGRLVVINPGATALATSLAIEITGSDVEIAGDLTVGGALGVVGTFDVAGPATFDDLEVAGQLLLANGTAAAPSLALANSLSTGLYRVGADQLGVSVAGALQLTIAAGGLTLAAGQVLAPAGTAALPSFALSGEPNTGLFSFGANRLGLSAGGAPRLAVYGDDATFAGARIGLNQTDTFANLDARYLNSTSFVAFPGLLVTGTSGPTARAGDLIIKARSDIARAVEIWTGTTGALSPTLRVTEAAFGFAEVVGSEPVFQVRDTSGSGASALTNDMAGLAIVAGAMNTTSRYTPALKFGSTDSDFTTVNPKFLAAIVGEAIQTFSGDTAGGMSLAFFASPSTPGAGGLPNAVLALTVGAAAIEPEVDVVLADVSPVSGTSAGFRGMPTVLSNAARTFALTDAGKCVYKNNTTAYNYTIDANADTAYVDGTSIMVLNDGTAGNITIVRDTGVALLDAAGTNANYTVAPNQHVVLYRVSSNRWRVLGG